MMIQPANRSSQGTFALARCFAAAIGFVLSSGVWAERTWPLPEGSKRVEVNGYDMTYRELGLPRGTAPTVVLLHGVGGDYRSMSALAATLAPRWHVVVPSLRHHFPERWDGKGGDYVFETHVQDVAALIQRLGIGPAHLFGETYGGTVAVLVARDQPQAVRSAVSYAGFLAAREYMPPQTTEEGAQERERTRLMSAAFLRGDEEEALRVHRDVIAGEGAWARSPEPYKQSMRENARTVGAMFELGPVSIPCDGLRQVAKPVLLMVGEKSHPASRAASEKVRTCLPGVTWEVVPQGVGTAQIATPAVAAALEAFFTAH